MLLIEGMVILLIILFLALLLICIWLGFKLYIIEKVVENIIRQAQQQSKLKVVMGPNGPMLAPNVETPTEPQEPVDNKRPGYFG